MRIRIANVTVARMNWRLNFIVLHYHRRRLYNKVALRQSMVKNGHFVDNLFYSPQGAFRGRGAPATILRDFRKLVDVEILKVKSRSRSSERRIISIGKLRDFDSEKRTFRKSDLVANKVAKPSCRCERVGDALLHCSGISHNCKSKFLKKALDRICCFCIFANTETMTAAVQLSEESLSKSASLMNALSDPARLRIVNLIRHGKDVCNCQIEPITGYLPSKISRHLTLLKQAGLLSERREGTYRYYKMKEPDGPVHEAFLSLLAEICDADPLLQQDRESLDRDCPC